jgi:hypothetical protein
MVMAGRDTATGRGIATGVAGRVHLTGRTNSVSRRLCHTTGTVDGAADGLVCDRARGIRHGALAVWRRGNSCEYARRCAPTGAIAERSAAGQPRHAGRRVARAVGSSIGAVEVNCTKERRTKRTHTSQMAGIAQVAARRKKGVPSARLPVGIGVSGALPLSMRRRGGGNDMARRRLLIWRLAQRNIGKNAPKPGATPGEGGQRHVLGSADGVKVSADQPLDVGIGDHWTICAEPAR